MRRISLHTTRILTLCVLLLLPTLMFAQNAPIEQETKRFRWDSGKHDGGSRTRVKARRVVEIDKASWIRLKFSDAYLGTGSHIVITSLKDGHKQHLNGTALAQWQNTSAYFNGDAVQVKLIVGRGDRDVFVKIREVMVGPAANDKQPYSQCGPTDDRVPSTDPRVGRMLNVGCTGWIIDNGLNVTAGHCSGGSLNVMQFNVPLSNANGSLNMPGPADQYAVDPNSKTSVNGGVGNDWGVFQVFDNSQTGLQPIQAQGASFTVAQDLGPSTIRITGFGVDSGTANQTNQTHAGPNAGSSGTTMQYQTDTQGGNSGSPVIDNATNRAVGVHTHGGCSTSGSGSNKGTSTFSSAFWAALNPAVLVKALPDNTPIVIPATGGSFTFDVELKNTTNQSVSFQFWTYARRSTGGITDALQGPQNVTLSANQTQTLSFTQIIPVVDAGSFIYYCAAGTLPNSYIHQDTFNFTITAGPSPAGEASEQLATFSANGGTVPETITLEANYPNPFNPTTIIRYGVNEPTQVKLSVYNMLGQEVRTLVNAFQPEGFNSVVWDATNNSGQAVSAGVYLYKLEAGDIVKTMRMTLTK